MAQEVTMTSNVLSHWGALHRKQAGLAAELHEPGTWLPPTDVVEDEHGLVVRMEIAGVARSDVHVWLESGALIVEGTRQNPCRHGLRFRQLEMDYGPFRRVVPMPCGVDGKHATAALEHGVLEICLPRSRRPMTEKIVMVVMT